jgi:hypothetical protein
MNVIVARPSGCVTSSLSTRSTATASISGGPARVERRLRRQLGLRHRRVRRVRVHRAVVVRVLRAVERDGDDHAARDVLVRRPVLVQREVQVRQDLDADEPQQARDHRVIAA